MADIELYRLTASQAIDLIRRNDITVEQYAHSLLARIQERDRMVKAWAYLNPEMVLKQARLLDKISPAERAPLHGLPIDMPTQHNSPIYEGHSPQLDAASVMILRNAGALIFGKTTTTEFASTTAGPKTCNPHDPSRTPGGSSSGSGAVVADFQVPIALGTQTGGSVIRPGSFNGVYGFKPTWNAISREGQKIYSLLFDTLGMFARSVEDLNLLSNVFRLEDDEKDEKPFFLRGAKFAFVKTMLWPQVGSGTSSAMDVAADSLRKQGAEVEEIELPDEFQNLPKWHEIILCSEGRVSFLPEYCSDKGKLSQFLIDRVENKNKVSRKDQLEAFDAIAALRPKFDGLAQSYAAIITPSVPDEAPMGIEHTGSAAFNSIWTALHVPVVNVPGFKGANGMPIGLSLVAPRYRDRHLLKVCKEVGSIFEAEGGWKC